MAVGVANCAVAVGVALKGVGVTAVVSVGRGVAVGSCVWPSSAGQAVASSPIVDNHRTGLSLNRRSERMVQVSHSDEQVRVGRR